jgi:hypothetical protein
MIVPSLSWAQFHCWYGAENAFFAPVGEKGFQRTEYSDGRTFAVAASTAVALADRMQSRSVPSQPDTKRAPFLNGSTFIPSLSWQLIGFNLMGMAQKRRSFVFRTEILCKVGVDRLRDVHGLGCPLRKGAALGDGGGEQALLEGSAHHVLHGDAGRTCSRTTQVPEIKRRERAKKPRQRKEGTV